MKNSCVNCGTSFEIDEQDLAYYKKVSPIVGGTPYDLPPPTLCPDCRQQRRFAGRNERHLYHRKCDLSGKTMITNFAPDKPCNVYEHHEWWSDKWNPKDYSRDFDFSRPFFEQYAELQREVPQIGLSIWYSENSDYCNYIGHVKDSYLIFGSVYSEDCYYGSPYYSKTCMDTLVVRECERCFECVDSRKLYECFYSQDCHSSSNLIYCYDLQGCQECIGCAALRNQKFCIFNEQLTEEQYRKRKKELDMCNPKTHEILKAKLKEMSLSVPHRYMQSNQVENVSGNYVYECKNVHDSFYTDRSEDCRYCAQVVDMKDCYDNNYCEENELCCEYLGAYQVTRVSFSKFCNKVSDALYCDACHLSNNLFGCISMRRSEYCILNKQYTKEEYEELVPKIIEHMRSTGEWGEYFPISLSLFGYNETVAQEYFPRTQDDVKAKNWNWYEQAENKDSYMGPALEIPENIDDVQDDICEKILSCESTEKLYRIIPQELELCRELHLPIARKEPNVRHQERLDLRNPRRLWDRTCDKCQNAIRTSYSPDSPERVYCEECYLAEVY